MLNSGQVIVSVMIQLVQGAAPMAPPQKRRPAGRILYAGRSLGVFTEMVIEGSAGFCVGSVCFQKYKPVARRGTPVALSDGALFNQPIRSMV